MIDENGPEIGNGSRPTHHWRREDQESKSVIDLTLTNGPIVKWTTPLNLTMGLSNGKRE